MLRLLELDLDPFNLGNIPVTNSIRLSLFFMKNDTICSHSVSFFKTKMIEFILVA